LPSIAERDDLVDLVLFVNGLPVGDRRAEESAHQPDVADAVRL
jgi:hypothetical protein